MVLVWTFHSAPRGGLTVIPYLAGGRFLMTATPNSLVTMVPRVASWPGSSIPSRAELTSGSPKASCRISSPLAP